jgi:hypothetical protein
MRGEAFHFAASLDGAVLARGEANDATVWHRDRPGKPVRLGPHLDIRFVDLSPDGKWATTILLVKDPTRGHVSDLKRLRSEVVREFTRAVGSDMPRRSDRPWPLPVSAERLADRSRRP